MKKALSFILLIAFVADAAFAGLTFTRASGITLTGADGITFTGADGIATNGADGILGYRSNGITLTGADGIVLTGADGITLTGADGAAYAGSNGIVLTGADGITLTGADGLTLTGPAGITLTGADGAVYSADSIVITEPAGITLTGADGITLTGADGITLTGADGVSRVGQTGITLTGADGITLTGADGITLTGADGITLTGADQVTGIGSTGVLWELQQPAGITLTGADGITLTGAEGITLTGADGITLTGADGITLSGEDGGSGIQSLDPELAVALDRATDDSTINAVVTYHSVITEADLNDLRAIGILGGTRFRNLPMIYLSGTKVQIAALSRLPRVRSIWGTRTLDLNIDPYLSRTRAEQAAADPDLRLDNGGLPYTGSGVTVAVLDTGINAEHPDLAGRVAGNVRLADIQSAPLGFAEPAPIEGLSNTDAVSGHGTLVAGIIAGNGASSSGRFAGIATGTRLLGLSAGDLSLVHVLAGFDYLLGNAARYNVRVVNCSFSANTVYDPNDPVNVATRMLSDRGVTAVFSAGNGGPGNGTMNPYAAAPWVISVGATDRNGQLAGFSSRGNFGDEVNHPDVVAPGVNIAGPRTAGLTGAAGFGGADTSRLSPTELPYYTTASGTSFSAPQVAAAAALMVQANPQLTPAEIRDIISRTATPLPKYFVHEAGAGMLNTHAAVLEAAFPERHLGTFRSTVSRNGVRFVTSVARQFEQQAVPGQTTSATVSLPANTVRASFKISWGFGANDLGLQLFGPAGTLSGASNGLNLAGLTGRRERIVLNRPAAGNYRMDVAHTGGIGTTENVFGLAEITRVEYPELNDLSSLSADQISDAQLSLVTNTVLPYGRRFRPSTAVSRSELAETILRGGLVPQYMAGDPMYSDVRDRATRSWVESVQSGTPLFTDISANNRFRPNEAATRLIAAIAFVRAAGLASHAATAVMPAGVLDAASIPVEWRGYAALALQHGFITLRNGRFEPAAAITRIELARAVNVAVAR